MRQSIRKSIILLSFLCFPLTVFFFSPFMPFAAASQAVLGGAAIVYLSLFLLSFFFGKAFCGWLCPQTFFHDSLSAIRKKPLDPKKGWIKFLIWVPWILGLITMYILAKEPFTVNFFWEMPNMISIDEPWKFIIYYMVLVIIFLMAMLIGNRSFCLHACWIAPFQITGKKLGQALHIPQLHLVSVPESCKHCETCNKACPKNLDVHSMVQTGRVVHNECILCGNCVDACPVNIISYSFSMIKKVKS